MKLTKSKLKQIIKEEMQIALHEIDMQAVKPTSGLGAPTMEPGGMLPPAAGETLETLKKCTTWADITKVIEIGKDITKALADESNSTQHWTNALMKMKALYDNKKDVPACRTALIKLGNWIKNYFSEWKNVWPELERLI